MADIRRSQAPAMSPNVSGQCRPLVSPADSDQELIDLEVATVLSKESRYDPKYASPSKNQHYSGTPAKSVLSPFRPSTVMTNLQRGNVQTTTPSLVHNVGIHQMAAQGELIQLQQEIEGGADVNRVDELGFTALLWACANGQMTSMEYLLERSANLHHTGNHGENSLLLAASSGYTDIIRHLLTLSVNPNYTDESNGTALMYSAYNNHPGCVLVLLEFGADPTVESEDGYSAMDLAVGQGHKADKLEHLSKLELIKVESIHEIPPQYEVTSTPTTIIGHHHFSEPLSKTEFQHTFNERVLKWTVKTTPGMLQFSHLEAMETDSRFGRSRFYLRNKKDGSLDPQGTLSAAWWLACKDACRTLWTHTRRQNRCWNDEMSGDKEMH